MELPFLSYAAASLFIYALVSKRLSTTPISAPMVFVAFGILGHVSGFLEPVDIDEAGVKDLLEITLALLLFLDASKLHLRSWEADMALPARLLVVGMPLTILLGTGGAVLVFPTLGIVGAAIAATILAPTDAALGQAVVSNPSVPTRIREALGIESGLNDGIALPILLFLLSLQSAEKGLPLWHLFFEGIGIAVVVGVVIGAGAAMAILFVTRRSWVAPAWTQIAVMAVAFGTFVITDELGGSGFIAAYVAGHVFGRIGQETAPSSGALGDGLGTVLTMVSFLVFGAFIIGPNPEFFSVRTVVYAILSLTLVRMIPVAISMIGAHRRFPTISYMGWFGPRGLASIIFAGVLLEESGMDASGTIVAVVMTTVMLSVFLHGSTAPWGAERYAAWYDASVDSNAVADD